RILCIRGQVDDPLYDVRCLFSQARFGHTLEFCRHPVARPRSHHLRTRPESGAFGGVRESVLITENSSLSHSSQVHAKLKSICFPSWSDVNTLRRISFEERKSASLKFIASRPCLSSSMVAARS